MMPAGRSRAIERKGACTAGLELWPLRARYLHRDAFPLVLARTLTRTTEKPVCQVVGQPQSEKHQR
jgi:hypothetical protein